MSENENKRENLDKDLDNRMKKRIECTYLNMGGKIKIANLILPIFFTVTNFFNYITIEEAASMSWKAIFFFFLTMFYMFVCLYLAIKNF